MSGETLRAPACYRRVSAMVVTTLPNSELSERPSCPRCESTMWITRIGPDVAKRVLECPVCDILEIAVVNIK